MRVALRLGPLLLATLLSAASAVWAQDGRFASEATLRGEVGLDTGAVVTWVDGGAAARVPVRVRARLELDASLGGDGAFRAVLLPILGAGTGGDDPTAALGLQEAFARLRLDDVDLSLGWERLPLAEMRLIDPVSVEPRLLTGEPRGALGVRAAWYRGPWRIRGAALALGGDDPVPDGAGAVLSVRREASAATVEAHLAWTVRPALGATVSASLGDLVAYGEAWLLADPWTGRGGAGITGYLGDWMWTAEAAWAAPEGDLAARERPTVAASASRPLGPDGMMDASLTATWPVSVAAPGTRATTVASVVSYRHDLGDASFTVAPSLRVGDGAWVGSLGLSVRGYF